MEKPIKEKDKEKDIYEGFGGYGNVVDPIQQLLLRVANLEQILATGKAFIKSEERPAVGKRAAKKGAK